MDPAKIQLITASIIPILFAITLHEVAHGWIADMRGDHTARMLGRLTLNPIKHIDPIGTVILPIFFLLTTGFMFGWAKPVPVNARYLKNPRFDMAWVAIAGPLSNFLMAFIWGVIAKIALNLNTETAKFLILMSQIGITINLFLALLNLIPIPPLDGSRVLSACLPPKISYWYERIEPFGFLILIALLLSGLLNALLVDPVFYIRSLIFSIFGLGGN
jgi:Zn-dependent protease